MILKALYDYYHRCGDLAPTGMEYKEISFLIILNERGDFVRIEDTRDENKNGRKFLVIKGSRTGTTPKPYLFWDNVEYTLNYTKSHSEIENEQLKDSEIKKLKETIKKAECKNNALIEKYKEISSRYPNNISFRAVCQFYQNGGLEEVYKSPLWAEIKKKPTVNISFMINGRMRIVAEEEELISYGTNPDVEEGQESGICLITGDKSPLVETTTATPIPGGQATAKLVAFQVNSGYDSYGKSKGKNAPISKDAEAAYTTALNKLISSKNRFYIGNRTMVFWASSNTDISHKVEESLFSLLGLNVNNDDPNRNIENVLKLYKSIFSGIIRTDLDDKFYFLGLAANSARIAVVYWNESSLKEFAGRILSHFNDMTIIDTRKEKKSYFGLYQMMSNVTLKGKVADVQPNLPEATIKSIIEGTAYPYSLFTACINRIRAEQEVTIGRAAILKAYLNRLNDNNKKIEIMLDKENTNQGYLCGRLFATLENLQERSSGGNSNIRSRYMNAASSTPAVVFPTILNLSVHHADKLDTASSVYFEKIKSEIINKLPANGFPAHLSPQDQGRFMVGYYQQRQYFFTKKEDRID